MPSASSSATETSRDRRARRCAGAPSACRARAGARSPPDHPFAAPALAAGRARRLLFATTWCGLPVCGHLDPFLPPAASRPIPAFGSRICAAILSAQGAGFEARCRFRACGAVFERRPWAAHRGVCEGSRLLGFEHWSRPRLVAGPPTLEPGCSPRPRAPAHVAAARCAAGRPSRNRPPAPTTCRSRLRPGSRISTSPPASCNPRRCPDRTTRRGDRNPAPWRTRARTTPRRIARTPRDRRRRSARSSAR